MNSNLNTASTEMAADTTAVSTSSSSITTPPAPQISSDYQIEAKRFLRQGVVAAKEGNRTQARYFLLESVRLNESNETAWLWLASVSEQPAELLEFLQRVLSINPQNERALEWEAATRGLLANSAITRGASYIQENQRVEAAECFRQAVEYMPENEVAWLWLASVTDELEDKLSYLQRVLNLNPQNEKARAAFHATKRQMARFLLRKGNIAAMSGDREGARQILRDVMEYDPLLEEAWLLKAYLTDSIEEKSECLRKALELNPNNAQAASGLASLQAMPEESVSAVEEDSQEIEEEWQEQVACLFCAETNPANLVRCSSCKAFVAIGDVEQLLINDAVDDQNICDFVKRLNAEIALRELTTEEHYHLGLAYLNLKNFKKSATHFEEVLKNKEVDESTRTKISAFLEKINKIAPELINGVSSSGKTIMVVDDSPTVRKLIAGKLEKHGHRVICAVDGMEALSMLNEDKPDLILLDVTMPRLDGYQLCKLVKGKPATKHIPVVMISGKDGFFDKVRGRMAGSTAYITKPFGPETLLQTVDTYCK